MATMNNVISFKSTALALARSFKGAPVKLSALFAVAVALSACIGEEDIDADASEYTEEQQQAATTFPPCTAANQGAQFIEYFSSGYRIYQCDSGTWQLIRSCKTGGVCVDH